MLLFDQTETKLWKPNYRNCQKEAKHNMKYKDYLLVPIFCMYLLYASCTYLAKDKADTGEAFPEPSISPSEICWDKDYWYAEGQRSGDCFNLENGKEMVIVDGLKNSENASYYISDMHMRCDDGEGKRYDLIFVDEMTAYDCVSGQYYQRADYDALKGQLISGKFVNTRNDRDYYIFKDSGKSVEYFGNKVFKGSWNLSTADTLSIYDKQCHGYMDFRITYSSDGRISGITYNDSTYILSV